MADSSSQLEDRGDGCEKISSSPPPPEVLQLDNAPPKLSTTSVDELSSAPVGDAPTLEPVLPHQIVDENAALPATQQCDNVSSETSLITDKTGNLLPVSHSSETLDNNSDARSAEKPAKLHGGKVQDPGEADQMASASLKTLEDTSAENLKDKSMSVFPGSVKTECCGAETTGSTGKLEDELAGAELSAVPDNSSEMVIRSEPSTVMSFVEDSVTKENLAPPSVNICVEPSTSLSPPSAVQPAAVSATPKNNFDNERSNDNVPEGESLNDVTGSTSNNSVSHVSSECDGDQRGNNTVANNGEPVSNGQDNPRLQKDPDIDGISEYGIVAGSEMSEGCPGNSHKADTESLPLTVNADSVSQEISHTGKDLSSPGASEVNNTTSSPAVLDTAQINTSVHKVMPSLETEPLQPVTIGSSLQPLEEVQEQSMMEDPSFTPDLDLIENSVDEPGSVGGLVINSVMGAADGIVDFQPDEEMDTDRELIDISASAPTLGGEGDEVEPSTKRMRFENGDLDDKGPTRKVTLKISPVKNGHGLWDSQKLLEILQAKGTILLRIHASKDSMEMFEPEKSEIDVDFTGVILGAKDGETDQILGLSSTDTDPDTYDPLAMSSSQPDHESPHYSRQHPLSRGRSTALQPAMARPVFKRIQSPPHYMKNEVLGLPPLEYEDSHLGAADWSGLTPFKQPHLTLPTIQGSILLIPQRQPEQNVKPSNVQVLKVPKVCDECFAVFPNEASYLIHKKVHSVMQQCGICNFKTKDQEVFRLHTLTHKEKQVELKCNVCMEVFTSPITYAVHRRKIHCLYQCKYCLTEYNNKIEWSQHMDGHRNPVNKSTPTDRMMVLVSTTPGSCGQEPSGPQKIVNEPISEEMKTPVSTKQAARVRHRSKMMCYICDKKLRSKKQLRVHMADHLGVPVAMITDENLYGKEQVWAEMGLASASYDKQCNNDEPTAVSQASGFSLGSSKIDNSNLTPHTVLNQASEFSPGSSRFGNANVTTQTDTLKQPALSDESNNQSSVESRIPQSSLLTTDVSSIQTCLPVLPEANIKEEPVYNPSSIVEAILSPNPVPVGRMRKSRSRFRVSKRVTCESCPLTFKNMTALKIHEKQRHSTKLKCPACGLENTSTRKVFHHQKKSHKDKFRCSYMCLELFNTKEDQIAHHKQVHNKDNDLKCRYCGIKYTRGMFNKHLKECTDDPIVRQTRACKKCGEEFIVAHEYFRHVEECVAKHGDDLPDKDFAKVAQEKCTTESTDIEMKTQNPSEKEKTSLAETTLDNSLAKVTQKITDNQPECDQQTASVHPENTHDLGNRQTVPANAVASSCPKPTQNGKHEAVLEKKSNTLPTIRHKCHFCPKSFENAELGISHIVQQHRSDLSCTSRVPKICHVCDKAFMSTSAFCKHILKHYGDAKTWNVLVPSNIEVGSARRKCWICNVSNPSNLRNHQTSRDGIIDSYFTKNLEQVTVEGEVFNCGICNESFPHRYAFWCHIKAHICRPSFKKIKGGKRFSCIRCNMTYKRRSELLMHLGKHLVKQEVKVNKKTVSNRTKKKRVTNNQHDVENIEDMHHIETLADAAEETQAKKETNKEVVVENIDNKSKTLPMNIETKAAEKEEIVSAVNDNEKEDDEVLLDKTSKDKQEKANEVAEGRSEPSEGSEQRESTVENSFKKQEEDKDEAAEIQPEFFRCEKCSQKFESESLAVHHAVSRHKIYLKKMMTSHVCHICSKTFVKPLVLCSHILNHYSELGMWEDFVPRKLLSQLLDRKYCWICNNMLSNKAGKHLKDRNDYIERELSSRAEDLDVEEPIHCSLCNYKCSNIYDHWKHVFLHLYKNGGESRRRSSKSANVSHDEIENPKPQVFCCSKCSCEFKDESEVTEHLASHFLSRTVEAEDVLPSRRMLRRRTQSTDCITQQREKRKHTPELPEVKVEAVDSDFVIESFPNFEQSQDEESVRNYGSEAIDKFWKCRDCDVLFDDIDIAVNHVLTLHKFRMTVNSAEPMNCYLCGLNFKRHTCMCRHIAKHFCDLGMWDNLVPRDIGNKINSRQCWICKLKLTNDYGFHTNKRNENIHKLLVSKCNEPIDYFSCSLCNSEFKYRHSLWLHMMRHLCDSSEILRPRDELLDEDADANSEEKKQFQCSDCSLSFPDEPQLYKHLALHFLESVENKNQVNFHKDDLEEIGSSNSSDFNSDEEWLPAPRKKMRLNQIESKEKENKDENKSTKGETAAVQNLISDDRLNSGDEDDTSSDTETSDETDAGYEETDDDDDHDL